METTENVIKSCENCKHDDHGAPTDACTTCKRSYSDWESRVDILAELEARLEGATMRAAATGHLIVKIAASDRSDAVEAMAFQRGYLGRIEHEIEWLTELIKEIERQ